MTIVGAHTIIFSTQPEADRVFLRDVLHLPHVDTGEGWLIFGLPAAELAVHTYKRNNLHRIYLMTTDIDKFMHDMQCNGISCSEVEEAEWGRMTTITLPGGGKLGVYQPKHLRPAEVHTA